MSEKINLSTKPAEMWRILDREGDKAERWYKKCIGGDKGALRRLNDSKRKTTLAKQTQVVFRQEWVSAPNDPERQNRWLVFVLDYYVGVYTGKTIGYSVCFYESHGSVGMFMPIDFGQDNPVDADGNALPKRFSVVFTSHFFLRYCDDDRKLGTMHDDKTEVIINFFKRNMVFMYSNIVRTYRNDDGAECIDMCLSGCVARGKVRRDETEYAVLEFDTCIAWPMLFRSQYKDCEKIINNYEARLKEIQDKDAAITEKCENDKSVSTSWLLEDEERDYVSRMMLGIEEKLKILRQARWTRIAIANIVGGDVYTKMHDVGFYVKEAQSIVKIIKDKKHKDLVAFIDECVQSIVRVADHYGFEITKKDALKYIRNDYNEIKGTDATGKNNDSDNKNKNTTDSTDIMNKTQITTFNEFINKQVKNFDKLLKEAVGAKTKIKTETYLSQVEPLYAISRIYSALPEGKDRDKLLAADRLWVEQVVDNHWCSALDPYIKRLGTVLVTMSIHFLMDKKMWHTPKGIAALQNKNWDYTSLEAIEDAQQCVCDDEGVEPNPEQLTVNSEQLTVNNEQLTVNNEQASINNEQASINNDTNTEQLIEFCDLPTSEDLHVTIGEAQQELVSMKICVERMLQSMSRVTNFVKDADPDIDASQKAAAELLQENERIKKLYNEKKAECDAVKAERDGKQTTINDLNNQLNTAKQKAAKLDSENKSLMTQRKEQADALKMANDALVQLRQQQEKPEVPTVTYDKIHAACPLMSMSNMRALAAFLQKEGICKISGVK